jgi:S1-C subfamily serine protease
MPQKQTLYDILGIAPDATAIDVGLAFERRMEELDQAPVQDAGAIALTRQAHEVLGDPKRRAAYDASLVSALEKAAAKEQAATPDLALEPDEEEAPRRRVPPVGIAVGIVALLVIAFLALRSPEPPAPKVAAEIPAEAPKPPPPPPPRPKSAKDILALAQASVGRLESFEMSGRAVPLGLAIAIEPATMVTTCHGIPAGAQLAVVNGPENRSATLAVVDETLDLCRLSVAAPPLVPLAVADNDARAGDAIFALGANAAGELAVTEGQVKRLVPDARGPMLELSMPVAATGSGGPVFDAYGKVVGIATTDQGHGASVSLGVPASWIAKMQSREKASPPAR